MKLSFRAALTFLIAGSLATVLHAQNFYWNTVSARSLSLGGVYVPTSSGVLDALATNPAGLSTLSSSSLDLSVSGLFARGTFSNSVNTNSALQTPPGAMPYGAFGAPIGHSRFSLGAGVLPELLSNANWRYVDAPGTGGASYGLQQQKAAILAMRFTGGVGFSISPRLAIGAAVGLTFNSNTLDAPYIFQTNAPLAGLKTLLDLHTTGTGWNTSLGVIGSPSKKLRLTAAWKSRTVVESTGTATGTLDRQFAALGIPFSPAYSYAADIRNVLPQSIVAGIAWQLHPRWLVALQSNWVNWHRAFVSLPVTLTGGTNTDINGFLGSSSISDSIPLEWKNQYSFHAGVEYALTEGVSIRGGFAHANDPVPDSTLSPLTAAIMSNQIGVGAGYRLGRCHFDLAWALDPERSATVQRSALLAGEYDNSRIGVGLQSLTLNTNIRF